METDDNYDAALDYIDWDKLAEYSITMTGDSSPERKQPVPAHLGVASLLAQGPGNATTPTSPMSELDAQIALSTATAEVASCAAEAATHHKQCPSCQCMYPESYDDGESIHCFLYGNGYPCQPKDDALADKCKKHFSSVARSNAERACAAAIKKLDAIRAPDAAAIKDQKLKRGVKVSWLKTLFDHADLQGLSTKEMVAALVLPKTAGTRCRFVELDEMKSHVGTATIFVSHAWRAPFFDTLAAVVHAVPESTVVWFDCFAARQWPGNKQDISFSETIHGVDVVLLVSTHVPAVLELDRTEEQKREVLNKVAFKRFWCMVEVATASAKDNRKMLAMAIGTCGANNVFKPNCSTEMAANLSKLIDVKKSYKDAWANDKKSLYDPVMAAAGPGGDFDAGLLEVDRVCRAVVQGARHSGTAAGKALADLWAEENPDVTIPFKSGADLLLARSVDWIEKFMLPSGGLGNSKVKEYRLKDPPKNKKLVGKLVVGLLDDLSEQIDDGEKGSEFETILKTMVPPSDVS